MFKWFTGSKEKEKAQADQAVQTPGAPVQPPVVSPETTPEKSPEKSQGGFAKLKSALSLTGKNLVGQIFGIMGDSAIDEDKIDEIEETLIRADVGLDTAVAITDRLRENKGRFNSPDALMNFLQDEFAAILSPYENANRLGFEPGRLNIYLVVGVNGAGKTTFIGKLAYRFRQEGKKVVIGAGDTFRAAAEDQLAVWAQRADADLVRKDGADPAAVIFEAVEMAKAQGADVVILDTAGRLQNKYNLMEELRKIRGVIDKAKPQDALLESLLVLDATTGQNALKQAEVFKEAVSISGVVLTKLDGSAKGGIVLTIAREQKLPVKMIGVGEGITDLKDFHASEFVDALFSR